MTLRSLFPLAALASLVAVGMGLGACGGRSGSKGKGTGTSGSDGGTDGGSSATGDASLATIPDWLLGAGVATLANFRGRYTISDLGTLPGGNSSLAFGINETGTVVGRSNTAPGNPCTTAFRFVPGRAIEAAPVPADACGLGAVINGAGIVVFSVNGADQRLSVSRINGTGQVESLGAPSGVTDPNPYPTAINSAGLVAITDWLGATIRAFAYSDAGGFKRLPTPNGELSFTHGMTDENEILGGIVLTPKDLHAVRWASTTDGFTVEDLNTWLAPGSGWVLERAKASNGRFIVGSGSQGGRPRGFIIDRKTHAIRDMQATVPSDGGIFPNAVNRHNFVVGSLRNDRERGFVAAGDRAEVLDNLIDPDSGWTILSASGLNDAGQIVGRGQINGQEHAFLLSPTRPAP